MKQQNKDIEYHRTSARIIALEAENRSLREELDEADEEHYDEVTALESVILNLSLALALSVVIIFATTIWRHYG